jgi:calcium-dependent protein kinase
VQHPWLREQGVARDEPLDSVVLSRMRNFANMNKLKKAALLFIAKTMDSKEISGLQQLFKSIDADGNGTITAEELRNSLSKLSAATIKVQTLR